MLVVKSDFDEYDYVISIGTSNVGTTFSGSCYTCTKDKNTIVHVTKWPEQKDLDNFEKIPTACLYDTTVSPPQLISWGKAAADYITTHPSDTNTRLISQFKLKLQGIFQNNQPKDTIDDYRTAAVDYLRAIHEYTCKQLIQNNPDATYNQFRYVLTVPATWVNEDVTALRGLAREAGLVTLDDKDAKLVVLSEAHAASLFCEREYCATTANKLSKGQRYLVCDAGGGTVDLATYECTGSNDHCQLALESGGPCGSTILDLNMELYLQNQVFLGCIEEVVLRGLVDQFKKKIKHYFGNVNGKNNNYIEPTETIKGHVLETELVHAVASATITTTKATEMKDIQENDYDYQADYDEYDSDSVSIDDEEQEGFDDINDNEDYTPDSLRDRSSNNAKEEVTEYVYFTLPEKDAGIDPSILESLALRGNITPAEQLRISHRDITKHVFDPVVDTVMGLIHKQIKKSYTTIDTLFLLGGFSQSPYLYKKIHEEFITNINAVKRLIVPEDGYRASMRGGIYYGIDSSKVIPENYVMDQFGEFIKQEVDYSLYRTMVAIDFDFYNFTAVYSFVGLNQSGGKSYKSLSNVFELKMTMEDYDIKNFSFDTDRFFANNFPELALTLNYQQTVFQELGQYNPSELKLRKQVYFDIFMTAFMQQLFEQIQMDLACSSIHTEIQNIRYCLSVSNTRVNVDYGKIYKYDPMTAHEDEDTPMVALKTRLSSALRKSKNISYKLTGPAYSFILDILNKNYFPIKSDLLQSQLPGRMFDVFKAVGMVYDDACKERQFFWRNLNMEFKPLDHGIPYFSLACYWLKSPEYSLDKQFNVAVVDQAHDSDRLRKRDVESCCRIYMPDVYGLMGRRMFEYHQLNYDAFFNDNSITIYINSSTILAEIDQGKFTVYDLLTFIGTETDFLKSDQLRRYIRTHVDLANPQQRHTIADLFLENNSQVMVNIRFRTANLFFYKAILHAIHQFSKNTVTTDHIRRLLLVPWIKYVLTPALLDVNDRFLKVHPERGKSVFYFVFTEPLIETVFEGRREFEDTGKTCSEYMIRELQEEIVKRLSPLVNIAVRFEPNEQVHRHFGCLIEGARLSSSVSRNNISMIRVARRFYAVHFFNYYVKKPSVVSEEQELAVGTNGTDSKEEKKTIVSIDLQDSSTLYPLINKDTLLTKNLEDSKFYVKNECSVAAVLYASEQYVQPQRLYISNKSFRKLHRFIIPVTDTTKPIQFSYLVEDYSILFSVKQAYHKADFRCNDLMFLN